MTRHGIKKVLFVCHGNILRSAAAEAYFRDLEQKSGRSHSSRVESFSAGVFAIPGARGNARIVEVAEETGLDLSGHVARLLSGEDIDQADLVCVMDSFNEAVCISRFPRVRNKLVMLGTFGRLSGEASDIDDPSIGPTETVRLAFMRVKRAVDGLRSEIIQ